MYLCCSHPVLELKLRRIWTPRTTVIKSNQGCQMGRGGIPCFRHYLHALSDQGPHSTAKEIEAQKDKMCLSSSRQSQIPVLSDAKVCARVSTCLPHLTEERKQTHELGFEILYQGHHHWEKERVSDIKQAETEWEGGQGSPGTSTLSR